MAISHEIMAYLPHICCFRIDIMQIWTASRFLKHHLVRFVRFKSKELDESDLIRSKNGTNIIGTEAHY